MRTFLPMRSVITLLKALIVLNLAALVLFIGVLVASFTPLVSSSLAEDHPEAPLEAMLLSVRAAMMIAILVVPFAHILLTRLRDIVETVQSGHPFAMANAGRLTTIAWCLLAIQLLDLGFGAVSFFAPSDFNWSFSLTGWLAVVLLFVLAKVFEHGAAMREELAGTV